MNNLERRWQDGANLVFGVWLFFSPWIVGYIDTFMGAAKNSWALGLAIALLTTISMVTRHKWPECINFLLGIWVFLAPVILGFSGFNNAAWNHYILGFLIVSASIWSVSRSLKITRFRD